VHDPNEDKEMMDDTEDNLYAQPERRISKKKDEVNWLN
jgi:hypothetical protein